MALADTEIEEIRKQTEHWSMVSTHPFARAIEAAVAAPLLARIAALTAQVEQAAQPVAEWVSAEFGFQALIPTASIPDGAQLYTAPPKAVPLTKPEKQRLWNDATYNNRSSTTDAAMEFGSAVEAHHGIRATVEKGET